MRAVRGLHCGAGLGVGLRGHARSVNVHGPDAISASCLWTGPFRDSLSGFAAAPGACPADPPSSLDNILSN